MNLLSAFPVPSLEIGGHVMTDLENLIVLCSSGNGASLGKSTPRKPDASSGYVVPASKAFRIRAIELHIATIAANSPIFFGYGDNDVGANSNTDATNLVLFGGTAQYTQFPVTVTGKFSFAPIKWSVPTGKYLFTSCATAATLGVLIYGYEVAV